MRLLGDDDWSGDLQNRHFGMDDLSVLRSGVSVTPGE